MSVNIKYKNNSIAELTDTGTKTLKTAGKYCEADIVVENTKDGGTTITDGIVIKARDTDGKPTAVTFYGDIPQNALGCVSHNSWESTLGASVTQIIIKNATKIGAFAFTGSSITAVTIPDVVDVIGDSILRNCKVDFDYTHENARGLYGYSGAATRALNNANPHLRNVILGGAGKPVTAIFKGSLCPLAANGVFTFFCIGDNVDAFLAEVRNIITTNTIVVKAAEPTTYNGTEYAAGDTIVTSTVGTEGTT